MDKTDDRTVLGLTAADRRFVLIGFPVAGVVLAVVLPLLWPLVADVDWIPGHDPLAAVLSLDHGWLWLLRPTIGLGLGLAFAVFAIADDTVVAIGTDDVRVTHNGSTRVLAREQIDGVFLDGTKLVIETAQGRRLLDRPVEKAKQRAREAFTAYGYPWEGV